MGEGFSQFTRVIWIIPLGKSIKLSLVSRIGLPNREDVRKECVEEKKATKVIFEGNLDSAECFEGTESIFGI